MDSALPLNKRIFKGSSIILLFTFLTSPIAYLIRVFYSHTLSVETYGLFYSVVSLFLLLATYNDLGFGYSVSYLIPKFLKLRDYKKCWNIYKYEQLTEVGTSTFLSLILILSAHWLSKYYFKSTFAQNPIYIFVIYFIANSFLEAINKFFIGLQQEIYYSSINFSKQIFTLIFSILFWISDIPKIYYFAFAWALAYILTAVLYNIFLRKNSYLVNKFIWDKELFLSMYKYAIPTLLISSLSSFIVYSDTIFLTYFKGLKEVGIYNIAVPLASISALFLSPINRLFLPLVSHLMESDTKKVDYILKMILKIVPFIGLYFSLFIFIFPSATISFIFGNKWTALVDIPLLILLFGYIPLSLGNYLSSVLSGAGKVKILLRISILLSIIITILSIILIPNYGAVGAALANAITYIAMVILYGQALKSFIKFKYPLSFYAVLIIFSAFVIITSKWIHLNPKNIIEYIIYGIIYTCLYVLLGFRTGIIKNIL